MACGYCRWTSQQETCNHTGTSDSSWGWIIGMWPVWLIIALVIGYFFGGV
jgi:hypothetical protein